MLILSIDPAPVYDSYCIIDTDDYFCVECGKVNVESFRRIMNTRLEFEKVVIEGMSSYHAAVGETTFDTCYEIGRLMEIAERTPVVDSETGGLTVRPADVIKRRDVKRLLHLPSNTNDAGIIQYLTHRFAPNEPNYGKGTKKHPSWFYGFKADIWQAYALGVAYIDREGFTHRNCNRFER